MVWQAAAMGCGSTIGRHVNHCDHRESYLPATLKGIVAGELYEDMSACSPHDRILVALHDDCRHGRDPGRTKES